MENTDSKKDYKAPRAQVIEVKVQGVLCSSLDGNERMDEDDYGDGGFGQV